MQKIHSITQLHTMPLGSLGMVKNSHQAEAHEDACLTLA